jgi:hypothetical protein
LIGTDTATAQFMIDHEASASRLRGLHASIGPPIKRSFESDEDAKAVFREILAATGLPGVAERILIRASAETTNAQAHIDPQGQRYIIYNATFMQELGARAKTARYWSLVFVVAHEVGHHLAGHLDFQGQNHKVELEADRYGGFILGRMGATHDHVVAAVRAIGSPDASETHSGRDQRVQVASLGWTSGGAGARVPPAQAPATQAPAVAKPAPARAARPDPKAYGATIWPKNTLRFGQTVNANTPYGPLTCTSHGVGARVCAWR